MARLPSVIAAIAVLASAAPAAAQGDADEIIVQGTRAEEMAQAYAGQVALAPAAADQYARWNHDLCPSVAGLAPEVAQTLIDHLALRGQAIGLGIEPTGCRPNLVIIFTTDSDRVAREIVDTRRDLMGYFSEDDVVTAGREGLDAFANTPRPVRWWHISNRTTSDGATLGETRTRTGRSTRNAVIAQSGNIQSAATAGSGFEGVESVRSQGTRVRRATRQDMSFALVIVDTRRLTGLPTEAVADYVAMAAFVQLDPAADMSSFPSVLNLFRDQAAGVTPTRGMTDWDLAYLQGLYSAERAAASTRQQQSDIARRITQTVSRE